MAAGLGANVTLASQNGLNFDTGGAKSSTLVTGRGTFGTPMYGNISTTATGRGSTFGAGGAGAIGQTSSTGFTTAGMPRTPQYITTIASDFEQAPRPSAGQFTADLKATFNQVSALKSAKNINVLVKGQVVVLQGEVATERERKLAEGLVRLTPGVHEVRNDLVVNGNANGNK
jgi:hypothetical protein